MPQYKHSILVVDDERMEREGIRTLIEENGLDFDVYIADSGRCACEILDNEKIDVLLTDVKMPFMDGFELCTYVKNNYPDVRIVIFSSYSDFEYAKKAIQFKVDDYLLKPIKIEDFNKLMEKITMQLNEDKKQTLLNSKYVDISLYPTNSHDINKVLELIHENYMKDEGLEWYAAQVHLSPAYMCELFKDKVGVKFTHYITQLRMGKAKEFLEHSTMKVNDVANVVGYSNVSYFGFLFKKTFGLSPGEFRKEIGAENETD